MQSNVAYPFGINNAWEYYIIIIETWDHEYLGGGIEKGTGLSLGCCVVHSLFFLIHLKYHILN